MAANTAKVLLPGAGNCGTQSNHATFGHTSAWTARHFAHFTVIICDKFAICKNEQITEF
jgi:hypothetical protein